MQTNAELTLIYIYNLQGICSPDFMLDLLSFISVETVVNFYEWTFL